jgi:hypothetical protein
MLKVLPNAACLRAGTIKHLGMRSRKISRQLLRTRRRRRRPQLSFLHRRRPSLLNPLLRHWCRKLRQLRGVSRNCIYKGKIVSTPPQSFTAEFFDETGKTRVELSGRRVLEGDFELFPFSTRISSKLRIVKPDSIKIIAGADKKGIARFSDLDLELECAYMFVSSTGRGSGICTDNQGNGYQTVF